jgi:tetratricopeptide (TPR) repeat protein
MRWVAALAVCLVVCSIARAEDWGVRRDPFDPTVVRRYKELLVRDPHDDSALRQLLALYQRYRTAQKLESEFRATLETREDWATLVVLARMPRASRVDTIALWKRALAVKPDDRQGWIAIGDASVTDAASARDAYVHAVALAKKPRDKRTALTKLITAARTTGDVALVDSSYVDLIALAPKDGGLWLDRGNAQLAAKRAAAAKDSFATAEPLLRNDPERRLTAIMNQGIALDGLGKPDDAIAQFERALDTMPRGYFLAEEATSRIVETERKRGQLPAAISRLEKRWKVSARGYFEWSTLGDLYNESHDEQRALDAYKQAVAKAPTEIGTQRKLITLLDKSRPDDALRQHEAAARVAPGDADLQLELAKRYHGSQPGKALKTLDALAVRLKNNVNVRRSIAALYEEWEDVPRAVKEYEAIVKLEPRDVDQVVTLGDAYWRLGQEQKALSAWNQLDKIGTRQSLSRHGSILAMHSRWEQTIDAYTKALALDRSDQDVLYGRARAYEALSRLPEAVEDARRAVALTAMATHEDGLRNRNLLVRVINSSQGHANQLVPLSEAVRRWRFAFERGDTNAGYMLVAHHARFDSPQQHDVLVALYRKVPTDDTLGLAVARSYARRKEYERAKVELQRIAERSPARAKDIAVRIENVDADRIREEREARLEEEGRSRAGTGSTDIVGRHRRFGVRLELGSYVNDTRAAQVGLGLYRAHGISSRTTVTTRFDWSQRDDRMEEVNAVGFAVGIATRLLDRRTLEVAAGIGGRAELRWGSDVDVSSWDRAALAVDATLEVLPRKTPASLGLRFQQSLTDDVRNSALFVELGFELR